MFARRKQKLRDDDEPLVPHGMVWQATEDEAMPADNLESREAVPPRTPAIPVPIDAGKTERKTENQSDENLTPTKLGAISQPIAWPSARIQQIVRPRPEPENAARPISDVLAEKVSVEKKTKPEETVARPQQPSSTPTSSDPDSETTLKKKPQSETLGSRIGRTSRRISLATSDFARALTERIRDISSNTASRLRRTPGSTESLSLSRLRELLGKLSGFVADQVRVIRPELRHMASDARSRVNNWRESIAKKLPQHSRPSTRVQEVSASSQELSATNQATAFTRVSTVLRREWNRKYRVRIPALRSPYWRAQLASANRQWVLTRTSLRRNERILMPMVMAGISALLAIALISGLRRYAPPVNASHSTAAQPQSVPEVRPASLLVPAAEASTPPKPSASQSAEKPKAKKTRHGDDYVAKNTYVYYGTAGKPAQTTKRHK